MIAFSPAIYVFLDISSANGEPSDPSSWRFRKVVSKLFISVHFARPGLEKHTKVSIKCSIFFLKCVPLLLRSPGVENVYTFFGPDTNW